MASKQPIKLVSSKTALTTQPASLDLKLAFTTISRKRSLYNLLYAYYEGDHPLRYSTERLKKAFDKIGTYFAQNWIAVIVDAVLDRLILKGFDVTGSKEVDLEIDKLWESLSLDLLASDVHEAATVTGEGYVIAWKEDVKTETVSSNGVIEELTDEVIDVYANDPRMCHVFYDSYRPTQKRFAAKMWINAANYPCMILYYPDRLEHYKATSPVSSLGSVVSSANTMQPDLSYGENGQEPNEYGIVPVFHFRSGRVSGKREIGKSEISLQDAVNKLFADMMVSSEFTTFAQRVIISQSDPGALANAANVNWWIPAGDGKGQAADVRELGGKSLKNYIEAIDHVAQSMAIISRTPKHYLMLNGGDPSGDALLAMEAPLVKKVKKRVSGYNPEWKALAAFLLRLNGQQNVDVSTITPIWESVESAQPLAAAQTLKTETEAGVPIVTAAARGNWSKAEINQLKEDLKEQQKTKTSLAQEELNKLRAENAADNTNPDGSQKADVSNAT